MKIGLFSDTFEPQVNGVVSVIKTLVNGLPQRGHEVFVCTVAHPAARQSNNVLRLASIPFPWEKQHRFGLPFVHNMLARIRELELDVIHSHTPFTMGVLANMASRRLSIPCLHTYHTLFEEYFHYLPMGALLKRLIPRLSKKYCNNQRAMIAPSRKMQRLLHGYEVSVPIHVVPNGIDLGAFMEQAPTPSETQQFRSALNIQPDERAVIYVGRIAQEKSVEALLRNFVHVAAADSSTKLLLVGDGPERAHIARLSAQLGIHQRVVFTGYLKWPTEIALAYKSSDVFVSASHTEIHPIVYIEALASGLPVVSYRDPSIEEMVIDDENGYTFANKQHLHQGITKILADERTRQRMAKRSIEIAEAYTAEIFADRMSDIYEMYGRKQ